MAWTTPKTWADGDIPDAADLNTHIKANLDVLSTHAHSGAAGDGGAALAPVSTVTFVESRQHSSGSRFDESKYIQRIGNAKSSRGCFWRSGGNIVGDPHAHTSERGE
jgi:hypothetical protein